MAYFDTDKHRDEITQLANELPELIEYDYWSAVEYGNESVDYTDTAINLIQAGYRKPMRKFFDIETREIITEEVLAETLEELKECDPSYENITLGQYINNCLTIHNGTLEEI